MNPELLTAWLLIGLLTGWVAGVMMKDGGRGRIWDLLLGLIGSSAAIGLYWLVAPGTGKIAMAVVAFVGAALVIVAQRKVWYGHA